MTLDSGLFSGASPPSFPLFVASFPLSARRFDDDDNHRRWIARDAHALPAFSPRPTVVGVKTRVAVAALTALHTNPPSLLARERPTVADMRARRRYFSRNAPSRFYRRARSDRSNALTSDGARVSGGTSESDAEAVPLVPTSSPMATSGDGDLERIRRIDAIASLRASRRSRDGADGGNGNTGDGEGVEENRRGASSSNGSSFDSLETLGGAARADAEVAQATIERMRVREYDVDARGLPLPMTAKKFSLFSSHRTIGRSSVSLALYLDTVLQFGILAFVLACVSAYSLAKNVTDYAFTSSYTVTGTVTGASAATNVTCERAYSIENSILSLSQGARCSIGETQSFYNCPMTCEYTSGAAFDATNACTTHYPCTLSDVLTDEQNAQCCTPKVTNASKTTPDEFQAVSIVVTICFLLFEFFYSRNRHTSSEIILESTVTAGDYSIFVYGLGKGNQWTRKQIADFFSHYGEVVSVCHLVNTHQHVMRERQIEAAVKKKGEIEAMILDGDFEEEKASFFTGIRRRLFQIIVLGGKKPTEQTLKELEDEIATLKAEVAKMDDSELMNLGSAVVTFNYEEHAMNACDDHMNDGWDWTVASVSRKFPPDFNGRRLVVQRAPEPSDINWQNLRGRQTNREVYAIHLATKLTLCAGLAIGGALQYVFEQLRANQLDDVMREIAVDSQVSFSTYVKLQLIASCTSLIVVIVNFGLDYLTIFLASFEMYKTKTIENNVLIATLTFVNLLNYVVVPVLTNQCSRSADGVCNWYVPGGFIEYAFYLQFFNVLALPFRTMDIWRLVISKALSPLAKTLQVQEDLLRPAEFELHRSYAELLKIIGLAAIYGPALPTSYAVAFVAIIVLYCCKKYEGLRISLAPPKLREDSFGITVTIRVISMLQILFGCLVFYKFDDGINVTLVVNIVIWAIALVPYRKIQNVFFPNPPRAKSTGDISFEKNAGLRDAEGALRSMRSDDYAELSLAHTMKPAQAAHETREMRVRKAFLCRMYKCSEEELHETGRLALYHPPVPTHANTKQLESLLEKFEPFPEVVAARATYLPGQSQKNGGDNTAPPYTKSSEMQQKKADILASFKRRRAQMSASEGTSSQAAHPL